jgi:hypothetical protein
MYFSDFIAKPRICKSYYLAGSDDFLKEYLIGIIAQQHNKRTARINNTKECKNTGGNLIFGDTPIWIVGSKLDVIPDGVAIKIGAAKITAKYKKAGYVEIMCSPLFDNQVESLVQHFVKTLGVIDIGFSQIQFLCRLNDYDIPSCYNTAKLLSLYGRLPIEEWQYISGNLSDVEVNRAIDNFIEGKYNLVMNAVVNTRVDMSQFCWALLNVITKSLASTNLRKPTWYQKKLQKLSARLVPMNVSLVLAYLYKICGDYTAPKSQRVFYLTYLLMYLQGSYKISTGDLHIHNAYY